MTTFTHTLSDLEEKLTAGESLTTPDLARVLACPDLVSVGVLGEMARRAASGDTITFCRVAAVTGDESSFETGEAGEVRITAEPASIDDARRRVQAVRPGAAGRPVTGFSLADLLALCGHDHMALAEAIAALRGDGLEAVAETPVDRFDSTDVLVESLRAAIHAGVAVPRFTIDRADLAHRQRLIAIVADVQRELGCGRAFAPLPRVDPVETPSTGYDDVKTIALARLHCPANLIVQVDWPLYGPKLAQVALAYGAGDVDGVSPVDTLNLGTRRSPLEEILRQIRAAGGVPVERDGRFQPKG